MPTLRSVFVAVVIGVLSLPLAACSEGDADDFMDRLRDALEMLEYQREREYMNDPFNSYEEGSRAFADRWPTDLPRPRTDTPAWSGTSASEENDWQQYAGWDDMTSEQADAYDQRLQKEGWKRESRTTGTDPATGREETTSTYRHESGGEIEVQRYTTESRGEAVWVTVR